jgi:hypothetical protein
MFDITTRDCSWPVVPLINENIEQIIKIAMIQLTLVILIPAIHCHYYVKKFLGGQ